MAGDIAVFVGDNGQTASPGENGSVQIYRRRQGSWSLHRSRDFQLDPAQGLRENRRQLADLVQFLGDCDVFVGRSVTGIPFFELEKQGASVWECEGAPREFLDDILQQEEARRAARQAEVQMPPPVREITPGIFAVSLKEIQEGHHGLTSKQVLLPLLRRPALIRLEIRCGHVPPWLETELEAGHFDCRRESLGPKEQLLILEKPCCRAEEE
ncbi:MAG TPA: Fe-only nitrogenase accessory AnfO family protein [Patescibacteria group bacterium]|nr:Fe-only nitrogenase accessory AnfO family protein [Patescibacteria group bacterium]